MPSKEKEDLILHEILRIVSVKPAKEYTICKAVNTIHWIDTKKEADEDEEIQSCDARHLFRELPRKPMWQCLLKLWNDGYTPTEASKVLKISYGTAYYYFKKFKQRKKPRDWGKEHWKVKEGADRSNPRWENFERIPEPPKERKARIAVKKSLITAAAEKRKRKAEKAKEIFERQQTSTKRLSRSEDEKTLYLSR